MMSHTCYFSYFCFGWQITFLKIFDPFGMIFFVNNENKRHWPVLPKKSIKQTLKKQVS